MNSTPVGLAEFHSPAGVSAVLACPHCHHLIEVPADGDSQESIDARAAWRLAEHVNAWHGSSVAPPGLH